MSFGCVFFDFSNSRVLDVGIESMLTFNCLKGLNWRSYYACAISLSQMFALEN